MDPRHQPATDAEVARLAGLAAVLNNDSRSHIDIVRDARIRSVLRKTSVERLTAFFESQPKLMEDWTLTTENNRSSPAWLLIGRQLVYSDHQGCQREAVTFRSEAEACANYALRLLNNLDAFAYLLYSEPPTSKSTKN